MLEVDEPLPESVGVLSTIGDGDDEKDDEIPELSLDEVNTDVATD